MEYSGKGLVRNMRVTNSMIMNNSKTNINVNKINVDYYSTQMSTQKKITRASDDPVIAIRSLRLRSELNELNQFYEKNIPDAKSWLDLTEDALSNMKSLITEINTQSVYGSNDPLETSDREAILSNLKKLRDQIYEEGNASYAGRTLFTGYKTTSTLTFPNDEDERCYEITEKFTTEDIEEMLYISNEMSIDRNNLEEINDSDMPTDNSVYKIRLSYNSLDTTQEKLILSDGTEIPISYKSINDLEAAGNSKDDAYLTFDSEEASINYIPETGELILNKAALEKIQSTQMSNEEFSLTYQKTGFNKGEIRPEMYFDCKDITDENKVIHYTKEKQEIQYQISFNQYLTVNTEADSVLDSSIGRDIDDMMNAVQASLDAADKVTKIKEMLKEEQYSDDESQKKLKTMLEAANREQAYAEDKMQKLFSKEITKTNKYLNDVSLAITNVGSREKQLSLTEQRMSSQQTTLEDLKSSNEDRDISDIIIDYMTAYTAYQSSLTAASKISSTSLLNYI